MTLGRKAGIRDKILGMRSCILNGHHLLNCIGSNASFADQSSTGLALQMSAGFCTVSFADSRHH